LYDRFYTIARLLVLRWEQNFSRSLGNPQACLLRT
jgi:hypothetical protein